VILIGLTGAAGAGKGEVASRLVRRHGFREMAFADPLYEAVSAIVGKPVAWLKERANKEEIIPWIGKSPRELLQLLGTEFGRKMIHPELWVRSAVERIDSSSPIVFTDVRFDNEAEAIQEAGGVIFEVIRPSVACLKSHTAAHESEQGIMGEYVYLVIENTGSLGDLDDAVDAAVASLHADIM
jgi:hypothetical protein